MLQELTLQPLSLIATLPLLSPLCLEVPAPFQHPMSAEQTDPLTSETQVNLLYLHADPFPRNRLAPIPNFEQDDLMRPVSPPYDPEQVVRDHETH